MNSSQARQAYHKSDAQTQIHPVKLIHMMYERTIIHLQQAEEGLKAGDSQKRGENVSRAIALITELKAAIRKDDGSEAALFLNSLYSAILVELPKVAISRDPEILAQAITYISRLKEIWEATAMEELEEKDAGAEEKPEKDNVRKKMFDVAGDRMVGGLSFSI